MKCENKQLTFEWIFCCGAVRSGSTLQYNLMSSIVEESALGQRVEYGPAKAFPKIKGQLSDVGGLKVFKTHSLTKEIRAEILDRGALAVYCFRDVRDVVVSLLNKGQLQRQNTAIEKCVRDYIERHYQWLEICNRLVISKYENFHLKVEDECRKYFELLMLYPKPSVVSKIANGVSLNRMLAIQSNPSKSDFVRLGDHFFDKKTLIHPNHIRHGGWGQFKTFLSKEEISLIEDIAADWLRTNGYNLDSKQTGQAGFCRKRRRKKDSE